MAALLGASDEDVEALCREAGEVWPANYNCPGQVVASGLHRGVDRLMDLARTRGIKAQAARRGRRLPLVRDGARRREAARERCRA